MNFSLKDNRVGFFAKTLGGKSNLLKHILLKERKKFQKIFVISLTETINNFYSEIGIPSNQIMHEYNEDWINDLMKRLTQYKQHNKKPYNVLLILDDITDAAHNSKALKKLFCMGRHLNISVVMLLQYLYQAPPVCRANFSFICCGQMNRISIDLLCDEFLSGKVTKQEFLDMYHESSKDYNFFIINNNSVKDNNDINSLYGTIKAE